MHCGLFGLLDVAIRPPYPLALSQTFKRILFDALNCSAINADVTALVMPPPITKNNINSHIKEHYQENCTKPTISISNCEENYF